MGTLLSKHFSRDELACRHCGRLPEGGMDKTLLAVLDAAREAAGGPIYVTSGYRCPAHNEAVGGAPQSYHVKGMAADVYSDALDVYALAAVLKGVMIRLGVKGGLQEYPEQGFVHVDVRGWWASW
jgi:uncharacterized protein YcbK (DUF882 family)